MNWVGGVRRRVFSKAEEKRRQEQFFAKHAAAAKLRGLNNSYSRNTRKDQVLDVFSSSRQRPVKLGGSHLRVRNHEREDIVFAKIRSGESCSVNSKDLPSFGKHHNQECNKSTDSEKVRSDLFKKFRIKPSSIHGPFSKYLLQLELQGVQKKIEDQKKNQQKNLKANKGRTDIKTSKDTRQCKEDLRAKQNCTLNKTKNDCSILNHENGISQTAENVRTYQ
ncbi:uncharacterized protein LOC135204334 [Macrobrachium nipponense]|uniref:uncharacterized protein LOC135204334 n=1 Tax=Macrobrachium nipponense TaxID=159736 RepID=UPI0030C8C77D